MILGEIRNYLKQRNIASLTDIAIHFDVSEDSARLAVNFWVNKGKVSAIAAACGSSCGGCDSATEQYQWVDQIPVRWYK